MGQARPRSLEEKIQAYGNPVKMLRSSMAGSHNFPLPAQYSSWPEEQRAYAETAVLIDMGQHMLSSIFKGRDVLRLMSACAVNSFAGFGKDKAKQCIFCRDDGLVIGDAIVVALEDDEYEMMGIPVNANWVQFQAQRDDYEVQVTHDLPTDMNPGERRFFRYQLQGPRAMEILQAAAGSPLPEVKFFHVGEIMIAGVKVRAISHTMSRKAGFELFGPRAESEKVLWALRHAGRGFGMRESGAISVPTSAYESGWFGLQVPAIYTGETMRPFREWMIEYSFEGMASLGGSFASENIDDYYMTPWDLGFGRLIGFDHDFVGRPALEKMAAKPPRRQKVWLRWDDEDVARVLASSLLGKGPRPQMLGVPYSVYATFPYDSLLIGDKVVGISAMCGYSVNVGGWSSLGVIDAAHAVDGARVELIWGDADTSLRPLATEKHVQTKVKATVSTKAFV
jgi:vanillate/3-O-methylgallate O-demethylase